MELRHPALLAATLSQGIDILSKQCRRHEGITRGKVRQVSLLIREEDVRETSLADLTTYFDFPEANSSRCSARDRDINPCGRGHHMPRSPDVTVVPIR